MSEPLRKRRSVPQGTKAESHRIRGKIDVHIPLKVALFEPIENVHRRFVERQRHLVGKVSVDLEDYAHPAIRTYQEHASMGRELEAASSGKTLDVARRLTSTWPYSLAPPSRQEIPLRGLPNRMRVEVDATLTVAKTVGELRNAKTWLENFATTTPR
jgi:hypothetical protein